MTAKKRTNPETKLPFHLGYKRKDGYRFWKYNLNKINNGYYEEVWREPSHKCWEGSGHGRLFSLPELRIFTELKILFDKVSFRHRIDRVEIDVFLPTYDIGIEFDGSHWHSNKLTSDKNKNKFFKQKGIKIIRVREKPLKPIESWDLSTPKNKLEKNILNKLVSLIDDKNPKVKNYCKSLEFENDLYFRQLAKNLPSPPYEMSFGHLYKEAANEWHPSKNQPLRPSDFLPHSTFKAWFKCSVCAHEWETQVGSRSSGSGCPPCAIKSTTFAKKGASIQDLRPDLAAWFHPTLNGEYTAENTPFRAQSKYWWQCPKNKGHVFEERVAKFTQRHNSKSEFWCRECRIERDDKILDMHNKGCTQFEIADALQIDQTTVSSLLIVLTLTDEEKETRKNNELMGIEERNKEIRKLAQEGKTYREVAKIFNIGETQFGRITKGEKHKTSLKEIKLNSERKKQEAVKLYKKGKSLSQISKIISCNVRTVRRYLPEHAKFLERYRKKRDSEIFKLYKSGKSFAKIASELTVDERTVSKIVKNRLLSD